MWYCGAYSFSWLWCIFPAIFFIFCLAMMFLCVRGFASGRHRDWMACCEKGWTRDQPSKSFANEGGGTRPEER